MGPRHLPQPLQEARLRGNGPLQGLDDDRGEIPCVPGHGESRGLWIVEGGNENGPRCGPRDPRGIGYGVRVLRGDGGGRALQGVVVGPVPSPFELEDLLPAGEGSGQAQGGEGSLGSGAAVAQQAAAGNGLGDAPGEAEGGLVEAVEGRTQPRLLAHRGDHRGVGVSQDQRPRAEDIVDVLLPGHVPDAAALAPVEHRGDLVGEPEHPEATPHQDALGQLDQTLLQAGSLHLFTLRAGQVDFRELEDNHKGSRCAVMLFT